LFKLEVLRLVSPETFAVRFGRFLVIGLAILRVEIPARLFVGVGALDLLLYGAEERVRAKPVLEVALEIDLVVDGHDL
jgi:hypothetical protein